MFSVKRHQRGDDQGSNVRLQNNVTRPLKDDATSVRIAETPNLRVTTGFTITSDGATAHKV
jgi:hypothetical protein